MRFSRADQNARKHRSGDSLRVFYYAEQLPDGRATESGARRNARAARRHSWSVANRIGGPRRPILRARWSGKTPWMRA